MAQLQMRDVRFNPAILEPEKSWSKDEITAFWKTRTGDWEESPELTNWNEKFREEGYTDA